MPIKRAKCNKCGIKYNIFVFSNPKTGFSFDNYPCRMCGSINKTQIAQINSKVEGYKQAVEVYDKRTG